MKTIRFILFGLFVVLAGYAATGQAEDIDIYSGTVSNGAPNLMFVVDNPASQNSSVGPCTYWDGTASSESPNALGNDQCALANIVHSLPTKNGSAVIKLGITTMCGILFPLAPIDDNPYPGTPVTRTFNSGPCSPASDQITYTIPAGSTNRQAFIIAVKALKPNTGKSGQGSELQETWAYYTGGNGGTTGVGILSGTAYPAGNTNATSGCQKNYIIYLSNVKAGASHAQQYDSTELSKLTASIDNATTLTAAEKTALKTAITPALENGQGREWARFMRTLDINTTAAGTGSQTIITYSVATGDTAVPPAVITNSMEKYIKAVATYGGGKYYPAGNDSSVLTSSILQILNEVQAVNSVFSSSSLPVSVNAQGTYLNQIYMGMFRPDPNGKPRWVGNLKQYHFAATRDATTHLVSLTLSDSLGASAINPGTGFITPNAISYWTCGGSPIIRACSPVADPASGFWVNDAQKVADSAGKAFDLPDGEWVDKGGAAQIVRLANLTDNYATAAGTATNPRKLYTCTGCAANDSLSGYLFANSNASLTAASFGIVTPNTITSMTRSGDIVTANTTTAHGLTTGQVAQISGAAQSEYNGSFVLTVVDSDTFTYTVGVSPASPASGTISANVPTGAAIPITSMTRAGTTVTVTAPGNTFNPGDSVSISGVTPTAYNGSWTISCGATPCGNTFTFAGPAEGPTTPAGGGSAKVGTTTRTIETSTANPDPGLVRVGTTVTVKTTANHGFADTGTVEIIGAPEGYNGTFSFTKTGNRTFTYTLPCTTPCTPATVLGTVTGAGSTSISIDPLTRTLGAGTAATATATTSSSLTAAPFGMTVGNSYSISISGAAQSQYNGTFTATVTGANTFTYPITTAPATPATGSPVLGSTLTAPDLIKWVRGEDSAGDETGPGGSVTVRPSLHGDVLHSRPVTVNYGGSTGVVVYYGGNDGVFRAVNGNQTAAIGSVPAGGELWGFIPTEFFTKLKRLHDNSPILDLPSTVPGILPAPQKKDYFADGSTGVYQKLNADGTTNTAYLYISMRRGGKYLYALDVSDPTNPKYLWKITNMGDFTELGQTWSSPRVALVKGYIDGSGNPKPVLIFGAGYDTAEDSEPAGTKTMGRGIYIVDAVTGAMVWSATYGASSACSGTATKAACTVLGMDYSIPADMTLMDSDYDGYIDRLYAVDVGGNVWRVDLQRSGPTVNNTPNYWRVHKVASLGGSCCPLRKFFYPADVVPTTDFDALIVGSGDREHPLYTNAAADKQNRIFMLKDVIGNDGSSLTTITKNDLFEKTTGNTYTTAAVPFGGAGYSPNKGYFIDLLDGEKVVNAPLTVAGYTYLGTNQPSASGTCSENLGIARGYRLKPLDGTITSTVFSGGGLPPSPVAGVVSITVEGEAEPSLVPFIIGGGGNPDCVGPDCASALGGAKPEINVSTSRRRTYWYQRTD